MPVAAAAAKALVAAAGASFHQPLDFVHIPKTGGQALESYGYRHGFAWGGCRMRAGLADPWPMPPPSPWRCSPFHIPPAVYAASGAPYDTAYKPDVDTFCVVRHPYTRAISEYMWQGKWWPSLWGFCTAQNLNDFVERTFKLNTGDLGMVAMSNISDLLGMKDPPQKLDCHGLPQWTFVDGLSPPHLPTPGACKHVLRYETLETDFARVLSKVGASYEEGGLKQWGGVETCTMHVGDLSPRARDILHATYKQDFLRFGYNATLGTSAVPTDRLDNASFELHPHLAEHISSPRVPGQLFENDLVTNADVVRVPAHNTPRQDGTHRRLHMRTDVGGGGGEDDGLHLRGDGQVDFCEAFDEAEDTSEQQQQAATGDDASTQVARASSEQQRDLTQIQMPDLFWLGQRRREVDGEAQ